MDCPEDTTGYLRLLARAEVKTGAGAWEEAASLWECAVAANPVEGRFWTRLADARFHTKDYQPAIAAYEKALELRDGYPAETAYRIAACHAQLQEKAQALMWLERALSLGYRDLERARADDQFASLRDDERFREIVALVDTSKMSREEGWRYDLRLLGREVKRRAFLAPGEWFDAGLEELSRTVSQLTDMQIIVEMAKLLRHLGDGHAYVSPSEDREDLHHALPVQFYLFEEGLFIIAADPEHADLLGTQVLQFGERTVDEAIAAVDLLVSRDNEQWPKERVPSRLRELPILHAIGLIPEPHEIKLTIRDLQGATRETARAIDASQPPWKLRASDPYPEGWVFFPETLSEPLPPYLKNTGVNYWFEYLPADRVVYFQFNRVRDDPRESFADFCDRLFGFVADHEVDKLVLDMRWNGGGNTFLVMTLLHHLIRSQRINRRGRLFVIIGRGTFSAAQNGVTLIDRHTQAIFVGEPTGSSPTFVGETVEFELPYSKVRANVSDLLWQSSWPMDYRTWIAPTIYTPPTFAAYRANRDSAMEAILACREHLPGW